jgi:hypothetical protein
MAASPVSLTDADILSFALNLEYLEAEFYLKATRNAALVELGVISESDITGPTTGGKMVPDFGSHPSGLVARGVSTDEVQHVRFLRSSLGSAAVKKPAINLDALGFGFSSWIEFIKLARIFEDTGVSAYNGAAGFISNKGYLEAAARLLGTEAEHAGAIRLLALVYNVESPPIDSFDVPPTQNTPFSADPNMGMSVSRTPQQVLGIVYGGHSGGGGFFPKGLNGTVK